MTLAINTDYQAFTRKICEEPDELTHRLVFADWLDENGDPEWSSLIRLQIEQRDVIYVSSYKLMSVRNYTTSCVFSPLLTRWRPLFPMSFEVANGFPCKVWATYGFVKQNYHSLIEWPIEALIVTDAASYCYNYHANDEYYYCPFSLPDGKSVDRRSGPDPICQEVGQRLLDYYRKELQLPPLKRN